ISEFQMSETEITQKQFEEVMGWNESYFRGEDRPVEQVTWYDCVSFCNGMSEADRLTSCYTITNIDYDGNHIAYAEVTCDFEANGYRLPTEAEWEYACRAGTATRFYTGDSDSSLWRAAWYEDNAGSRTHDVGEKDANAWGLYDMHGNVWECCWDWFSATYYGDRPNPDSDPTGPSDGPGRIMRGDCFSGNAHGCRSANRYYYRPYYVDNGVGFRVVRAGLEG
ncbi:MAG: formylglycine-generating enzyme family protein, partial [Candidatus Coatesbacteria bacterium]|nr:formylglycine-generating enzyme family protein [Candidatus Coatesbacteria bacterium]